MKQKLCYLLFILSCTGGICTSLIAQEDDVHVLLGRLASALDQVGQMQEEKEDSAPVIPSIIPENITINLPRFGTISGTFTDEQEGLQIQQREPIQVGPLLIKGGQFKMKRTGEITYQGQGTLFDKPVSVAFARQVQHDTTDNTGQKKHSKDLKLEIELSQGISRIEIVPGRPLETSLIVCHLKEGKEAILYMEGTLAEQKVVVEGTLDVHSKNMTLQGTLQEAQVGALVPELQNTALEDALFEGTIFLARDQGMVLEGAVSASDSAPIQVGEFSFKEGQLYLSTQDKVVTFTTKSGLFSLPLKIIGQLKLGKEKEFFLETTIEPGVSEIKPFKNTPIPYLQDIIIHDIKGGGRAEYSEITGENEQSKSSLAVFLQGSSTILHTKVNVILKLEKPAEPGEKGGIILITRLPDGWTLPQSFPELFNKEDKVTQALQVARLDDARFVITSYDTVINNVSVEAGINFQAFFRIDEHYENKILSLLQGTVKQLGEERSSVLLSGSVNPLSLKTLSFKGGLTTGDYAFQVGPTSFYGSRINLVLRGEPSLGLEGVVMMKPTPESQALEYAAEVMATPIKVGVAGSMKEVWKEPFGVPGFEFGNLGLRGTITYDSIAEAAGAIPTAGLSALAALVPGDLGAAGKIVLGKGDKAFDAEVRLNLGKDISSIGLEARAKKPMTLTNLLHVVLKEIKSDQEIHNIVPLQLHDVMLKFVPLGTSIGNIKLESGIGGSFSAILLGQKFHADCQIGADGLIAKASMPSFAIGPLKIAGFEGEGRPTVDMEFTSADQKIVIDGLLKIADIVSSRTKLHITTQGLAFETEKTVGPADNALSFVVKGSSIKFDDPEKLVKLKPEDINLEFVFKKNFSKALNKLVNAKLEEVKHSFEQKMNDAAQSFSVSGVVKDVKEQEQLINNLEKERKKYPLLSAKRTELDFQVAGERLKLGGLKVKEGGSYIAQKLGLSEVLQELFGSFKDIGIGVIEQGQFVFKNITELIVVKDVTWKGSLNDISNSRLPGLRVAVVFKNKDVIVSIPDFDFSQPEQSIELLAQELVTKAQEALLGTKQA